MLKKLKYISVHTEGSNNCDKANSKVRLIFSPLFARSLFQTARFEEETAMSTNRESNFVAVGYRNRTENSQERGKSLLC